MRWPVPPRIVRSGVGHDYIKRTTGWYNNGGTTMEAWQALTQVLLDVGWCVGRETASPLESQSMVVYSTSSPVSISLPGAILKKYCSGITKF